MAYSRRDVLQNARPYAATHAGLWLDKFYDASIESEKTTPEHELVEQVAGLSVPQAYDDFFKRWEQSLNALGAQIRRAKVKGRLAINLGAESVLETSIALHRTYGVPYIPGSALKGLAASFAHQHLEGETWRKGTGEAHKELFGTTEQAGCVTFFDALYMPGSGHQGRALWPDIITVHHPDYYQGKNNAPPADWDSPTPINFLTATGTYLIALAGPDAWVQAAFSILEKALASEGIGAKTNSGYGRMRFVKPEPKIVETFEPGEIPEPGVQFKGVVFDPEDNGKVWLELPGLDADEICAVLLPGSYPAGRKFHDNENVRCEVIRVTEKAKGYWEVECKTVKKKS